MNISLLHLELKSAASKVVQYKSAAKPMGCTGAAYIGGRAYHIIGNQHLENIFTYVTSLMQLMLWCSSTSAKAQPRQAPGAVVQHWWCSIQWWACLLYHSLPGLPTLCHRLSVKVIQFWIHGLKYIQSCISYYLTPRIPNSCCCCVTKSVRLK